MHQNERTRLNRLSADIVDAAINGKLSRKRLGLLINFNVVRLRDGIKRMVNQF